MVIPASEPRVPVTFVPQQVSSPNQGFGISQPNNPQGFGIKPVGPPQPSAARVGQNTMTSAQAGRPQSNSYPNQNASNPMAPVQAARPQANVHANQHVPPTYKSDTDLSAAHSVSRVVTGRTQDQAVNELDYLMDSLDGLLKSQIGYFQTQTEIKERRSQEMLDMQKMAEENAKLLAEAQATEVQQGDSIRTHAERRSMLFHKSDMVF